MFSPKTEYDIINRAIAIVEFHRYAEDYVVRPPYQRKNVWSVSKQRQLLDSMFRRYYVPRIVMREVRLSDEKTLLEVVDGQQRIHTAQRFFGNEIKLPSSLEDLNSNLPGKTYKQLPTDMKRFVDRELVYDADVIKGIDNPNDPGHQKIAAEIFWRLQQGENLTYMEIAHSRLSSLVRNFVVKYADDIRFDYDSYKPVDSNNDKHAFFSIVARGNERMQHLALLTRFLMIEHADGAVDMKDSDVSKCIDDAQEEGGIANYSLEISPEAKAAIATLNVFRQIFNGDPMLADGGTIKELRIEYFIISIYMLLRHLRKHYVFDEEERALFREFIYYFHKRWRERSERDPDVVLFADSRQQSKNEIDRRHMVLRQIFFEYAAEKKHEMLAKDDRRAFSEAERIAIYRHDKGLCQHCLSEDKPEKEALVPWAEYEADHVLPHSKGGRTEIANAQVLCAHHNRAKGNKSPA